jgi:ABC-2 type transport system ATP-binding protein
VRLEVAGLVCRYGPRIALDDVSLEVRPGEIVGLLGPNGAGKSSLLRTAAGLQPTAGGRLLVDGHDLAAAPLAARRALGYAPEEPAFYEELSAAEHLAFVAGVRGLDPSTAEARAQELCGRLGLAGRLDEPVRRFSHGMRKKLSFAAAALHGPRLLLCDEALEGFDVPAALAAREEILALARGGTGVLFSSHAAGMVERLCDRAVMLAQGRIVRVLARDDWGGADRGPSVLEREFLKLGPPPPATPGAAPAPPPSPPRAG